MPKKKRTTTKPLPHQEKCVRKVQHFGMRALIADDQGLGKTFESLLCCVKLDGLPAVVICPSHLKLNWKAEAERHFGLRVRVLEGRTIPARPKLESYDVVIINFEILKAWLRVLRGRKFATLIIDECQSIKNRDSKQYKNALSLHRTVKYFLPLSGTPMLNRPKEIWPVLNMLRPDIWPSFRPFAVRYCRPKRTPWGMSYDGSENEEELNQLMLRYAMIRRLKSEAIDLPDKVHSVVPLPIKGRKEYEAAERDFLKWLEKKEGASRAKKAQRAARLVAKGYARRLAVEKKLPYVMDWIDNFLASTDDQLVLMGYHKKPMQELIDRYSDICVAIRGGMSIDDKNASVKAFQSKRKRLLIGQFTSAGTGLTLTAANHMAFYEIDWVPGVMEQLADRIHRIGQTKTTFFYWLVASDTVEESVARTMQDKSNVTNKILDAGGRDVVDLTGMIRNAKTKRN